MKPLDRNMIILVMLWIFAASISIIFAEFYNNLWGLFAYILWLYWIIFESKYHRNKSLLKIGDKNEI